MPRPYDQNRGRSLKIAVGLTMMVLGLASTIIVLTLNYCPPLFWAVTLVATSLGWRLLYRSTDWRLIHRFDVTPAPQNMHNPAPESLLEHPEA